MRFVASGNFLFAIAVFFLPWIDVRCEMGGQKSGSLVEQTGYQIAQGEYTEGEVFKDLQEKAGQFGGGGMNVKKKDEGEKKEKGPDGAPILWGFVGLLGLGAVLCLAVPGKNWRAGALVGVIGAVAVLGIQASQGFPIEKSMKEDMQKENPKPPKAKNDMNLNLGPLAEPKLVVGYKPGYFLAWGLSVLPLLWILIDSLIASPKPAARDRGRDRDDDDRRNPLDDD